MTKLSPETLLRTLRANPRAGSAALCRLLGGINRSTLARGIQSLGEQLVSRGGSRRTRYAARRALRGTSAPITLYRIDASGRGHEMGHLDLLYPAGSALGFSEACPWPLDDEMRDGWFDGLPYPLVDMRPQGFLGRHFARQHALDLAVSANPEEWSEDDIAYVLATFGHDLPGDLVLGEASYRRLLEERRRGTTGFLTAEQVATAYPALATAALTQGVADSSAGGEFPKFTAQRRENNVFFHVIVKFSGADNSPAVRRWADLLVCEHLALETVRSELPVRSAESIVRHHAGRTFLEVKRFDRHGEYGRSPVCTLGSLNAALIGMSGSSWPRTAQRLQDAGWLSAEDEARIARIWWFGKLIGNTDMHEDNLAFRPGLTLAPIYDMLPMLYAPLRGGELPSRAYAPEFPLPGETTVWRQAADAALLYWQQCSADSRISTDFQQTCATNGRLLAEAQASI